MTQIKAHIPKIRFKEFSWEWEEKKLWEILTIWSWRDYKHLENWKYPVYWTWWYMLSVSDYLYDWESVCIWRKWTIDKPRFLTWKFWTVDTLFYTYSFVESLPKYVFYIFNTINWQEYNEASWVPSLSKNTLNNIKLFLPSLPEQQKIASFLSSVDEKIEKIKEKKKNLEEYKKWVMQKIFSQEIRFKDENQKEFGEWEEKKIWEIFEVTRWYVLAMTELKEKNDDFFKYPVYSSQTKNNWLAWYYNDFLYENAITWTTDWANAWDVKFRKWKFYCTNVCGVLLSKEWYANLLIAELLNSITHKYVSYVWNPKLMNNVMSNIVLKIPSSIKEQERVADFLSGIDEKIKKVSDELEKMEEFKKGLLQGMFV